MLVIKRKLNEAMVHVYPDGTLSTFTVLNVDKNEIKMSIDSPHLRKQSMLIVTRRLNESIKHVHPDGTLSTFTIIGISGNQVKIGINAPREVIVHRKEIFNQILKENDGIIPGTDYEIDANNT